MDETADEDSGISDYRYDDDVDDTGSGDDDNDQCGDNVDDDDGYACNKCQEPLEEACATHPALPLNTKDTASIIVLIIIIIIVIINILTMIIAITG